MQRGARRPRESQDRMLSALVCLDPVSDNLIPD
jgi:hypothetical protein